MELSIDYIEHRSVSFYGKIARNLAISLNPSIGAHAANFCIPRTHVVERLFFPTEPQNIEVGSAILRYRKYLSFHTKISSLGANGERHPNPEVEEKFDSFDGRGPQGNIDSGIPSSSCFEDGMHHLDISA